MNETTETTEHGARPGSPERADAWLEVQNALGHLREQLDLLRERVEYEHLKELAGRIDPRTAELVRATAYLGGGYYDSNALHWYDPQSPEVIIDEHTMRQVWTELAPEWDRLQEAAAARTPPAPDDVDDF